MKKILASIGFAFLLLGALSVVKAGTPLDQGMLQFQGPYSNSNIYVSTIVASGVAANTNSFPALSAKNTGGPSGRNCITKEILQLSVGTTFYLIDGALNGGTTIQTILGSDLAASGSNTLVLSEDHLGPLCGTAGNAMYFFVPAPAAATVTNSFSIEGYTYYAPFQNSGQ